MENKYDMDFTQHVKLDSSSPTGLVWVNDRYSGKNHKMLKCRAGDVAGSILKASSGAINGWQLKIRGKNYRVSRIVWKLLHGNICTKLVIDHIDGNPLNNTNTNLRLVSSSVNSRNLKLRDTNTSGFHGVNFRSTIVDGIYEYSYWIVIWRGSSGKQHSKGFSVNKLGNTAALAAAISFRKEKIAEMNTLGAGYLERISSKKENLSGLCEKQETKLQSAYGINPETQTLTKELI